MLRWTLQEGGPLWKRVKRTNEQQMEEDTRRRDQRTNVDGALCECGSTNEEGREEGANGVYTAVGEDRRPIVIN